MEPNEKAYKLCPSCKKENKAVAKFCVYCGTEIMNETIEKKDNTETEKRAEEPFAAVNDNQQVEQNISEEKNQEKSPFEEIKEDKAKESKDVSPKMESKKESVQDSEESFKKVETIVETYKEPQSVFAEGLPEWTIEPPQIMVRRKKK